ncbi:YceI family protein [Pseudomonas pergaminensis]|uniref:UPF0312 protein ACJEBJ_03885 n=1 Tax=Pseudomonas pergaminensis TaxID=2853159 RepID=A0ABW8QXJ2_9PSED|nr:YceI family protein [Pseudomonas sp.]
MLKKTLAALAIGTALLSAGQVMAADYKIDKEGQHAFIDWKISHLGYSFIHGTFKDWDGTFSWDAAKPEASKIAVDVKTASLWSNHAERDKHIASKDFLDVAKFADAKFVSTAVKPTGEKTADVTGDLTFHGVTKPVTFKATFNGEGKDPWGGERAGFNATTTVNLNDFGIKGPGPSSQTVDLDISLEGVKTK